MKYEANIYQMKVDEHTFWVAESRVLKGCVGQGDTSDDAIKELEQNEEEWLETAAEMDIPIPQPAAKNDAMPSGRFALRLAPNVYADAVMITRELQISLNQYFSNAILCYNTECQDFLREALPEEATYLSDDTVHGMSGEQAAATA